MTTGNSLILQLGKEASYAVTPMADSTFRLHASKADFEPVYDKKNTGELTGGKTAAKVETMYIKVEGSTDHGVRPDEVGLILKALLGVEATPDLVVGSTGAYSHIFTAIGTSESDHLPSLAARISRGGIVQGYSGLKINSVSFSAAPGDFLKMSITYVGKDEISETLTAALVPSALKTLKFHHAVCKVDGDLLADVTNIKLDYNNNLMVDTQTTSTGLYAKEPEAGQRDIAIELEALYSSAAETERASFYKTDAIFSLEIVFTSDEEIETGYDYSMKWTINNAQMQTAPRTVSGASDPNKITFTAKAIEDGADPLIEVELVNARGTVY